MCISFDFFSDLETASPHVKESTINSLGIAIKIGDTVIIGRDVNAYDIAQVDNIQHKLTIDELDETGRVNVKITYYQLDETRMLVPMKRYRKPWTDECQENAIIMSLGSVTTIDKETQKEIQKKTKDVYAY